MNDVKKLPALEVVKFICVAAMVFVHSHIVLITYYYTITDTSGFFYRITDKFMFVGLFLMTLPILAGVVFRMNGDFELKRVVKLAFFISFLGFFMNAITWSPIYTFSWNILQFIGLSFVVIAFLMKFFSTKLIFLLSLVSIFIAGPLRNIFSNFGHSYLVSIFIGANNQYIFWPFFPWFGLVGFGFLFAHYYVKYKDNMKFNVITALTGALLILTAVLRNEISPFLDPKYVWGPSLFQPKIGWVLASIGFFCVLVAVCNFFFSKTQFSKYGIVNSYSKGILWIYIVQMFASYNLSFLVKRYFPMNEPSFAYFILPVSMIFLSWIIGALSIKLFTEKIIITLKKVQ